MCQINKNIMHCYLSILLNAKRNREKVKNSNLTFNTYFQIMCFTISKETPLFELEIKHEKCPKI